MRLQRVDATPPPDVEPGIASRTWWTEDLTADSRPPYSGTSSADLVVIGGGFTGLWTALTFKERNPRADVILLEAVRCGWGASGRNGGAMHGYWSAWPKLPQTIGYAAAEEISRMGSEAQTEIIRFAKSSPIETQLVDGGHAVVATSRAQEEQLTAIAGGVHEVPEAYRPRWLTTDELWRTTRNPNLSKGLLFPEGATIQPAYLCAALKDACVRAGVAIFESTAVKEIDQQNTIVHAAQGRIQARDIVLATNAWMSPLSPIKRYTTNLSSHVAVTEPLPDVMAELDWPPGVMIRDARMFLHWVRTTPDSRFVVGTGAGPFSANGRVTRAHSRHPDSTERVMDALGTFVPAAAHARFEATWGGPIELSSDNCPFFATLPGTQIHYGSGYSGHGVNAAWIGGQVLASLASGANDRWTKSAFCKRIRPVLPPEPARYVGGSLIRRATLSLEDSLDREQRPSLRARTISALPRMFGIRIGTR